MAKKQQTNDGEGKGENPQQTLTLALQPQSELMPIAEEKDSPVGASSTTIESGIAPDGAPIGADADCSGNGANDAVADARPE